MSDTKRLRLDKWLWFARVVRTRALAQELAAGGHVRVNGQRAEGSSKAVKATKARSLRHHPVWLSSQCFWSA